MPYNPSNILGYWVNKAAQAFQKHLEKRVAEYNLKWTEAVLVLILYERPNSLVELARVLEHKHPSVLRQIDSLEESGLVERQAHPEDRRVKIVSLTEKGNETAQVLMKVASEIHGKAVEGMSEEKARELMFTLRDVIFNLGESDLLAEYAMTPYSCGTENLNDTPTS